MVITLSFLLVAGNVSITRKQKRKDIPVGWLAHFQVHVFICHQCEKINKSINSCSFTTWFTSKNKLKAIIQESRNGHHERDKCHGFFYVNARYLKTLDKTKTYIRLPNS